MYGTPSPTLLVVAGVQSHRVTIIKELKMLNRRKKTKAAKIRSFIAANPNATARYIADQLAVSIQSVYNVQHKLRHPVTKKFMGVTMATEDISKLTDEQALRLADNLNKPKMRMLSVSTSNKSIKPLIMEFTPPPDPVNNPAHYTEGGIETIDYIEAKRLGYHLGNAVKYISRAGRKGTNQGLEDLKKAQWYLARAIEKNEYASPSR
jgi:hypothetical protein